MSEQQLKQNIIHILKSYGWNYILNKDIDRNNNKDPFIFNDIKDRLFAFNKDKINKHSLDNDKLIKDIINLHIANWFRQTSKNNLLSINQKMTKLLCNRQFSDLLDDIIYVIDYDKIKNNIYTVSDEVIYKNNKFDLVLFVNGFPLVVIELKDYSSKTATKAIQDLTTYQHSSPDFFASNLLLVSIIHSVRYGVVGLNEHSWLKSRYDKNSNNNIQDAIYSLLSKAKLLRMLQYYTLFRTVNETGKLVKIIPRYYQLEAADKVYNRSLEKSNSVRGLISHYQGSGKTLLMFFIAYLILKNPKEKNIHKLKKDHPLILIFFDRTELRDQTYNVFDSIEDKKESVQLKKIDTGKEFEKLLNNINNESGIKLLTMFLLKDTFVDKINVKNSDKKIIVLVDEAHRTQYDSLGINLRKRLFPDSTQYFGFTGTPVIKEKYSTYEIFGNSKDKNNILDEYNMFQSQRDGTSVEIKVQSRPQRFHINEVGVIDDAEKAFSDDDELTNEVGTPLSGVFKSFLYNSDRIQAVCEDIVNHYHNVVSPHGFKAQVVVGDRYLVVEYRDKLRKYIELKKYPYKVEGIMTCENKEREKFKNYTLTPQDESKFKRRFNDPAHHLSFLVVTAKLLTGFDAPIEQVMYLDKYIKNPTMLFQTITRTNRCYYNPLTKEKKRFGIIVDYLNLGKRIKECIKSAYPGGGDDAIKNIDVSNYITDCIDRMYKFKGMFLDNQDIYNRSSKQDYIFYIEEHKEEFIEEYKAINQVWEQFYVLNGNEENTSKLQEHRGLYKRIVNAYDIYYTYLKDKNIDKLVGAEKISKKISSIIHNNIYNIRIVNYSTGSFILNDELEDIFNSDNDILSSELSKIDQSDGIADIKEVIKVADDILNECQRDIPQQLLDKMNKLKAELFDSSENNINNKEDNSIRNSLFDYLQTVRKFLKQNNNINVNLKDMLTDKVITLIEHDKNRVNKIVESILEYTTEMENKDGLEVLARYIKGSDEFKKDMKMKLRELIKEYDDDLFKSPQFYRLFDVIVEYYSNYDFGY